MEHILRDRTSHIHRIKESYEEENQRQRLKMRDMRDELLWSKKQLPVAHEENQRHMLKMRDMRDELLWYKKQLPIAHTSDDREPAVHPNRHADGRLAGPPRDKRDRHPRHFSQQKPNQHRYGNRA
jgi:hypothetical protein